MQQKCHAPDKCNMLIVRRRTVADRNEDSSTHSLVVTARVFMNFVSLEEKAKKKQKTPRNV
jgi:hypothetical protein